MKCQAHIMKTYKKKKADSCNPLWKGYKYLPECGGEITIKVSADSDSSGGCRCDSYPVMAVDVVCSKCSYGWWPRRTELESAVANNEIDVTGLFE